MMYDKLMENFINLSRQSALAAGIASSNQKYSLISKQARLRLIRIKSGHLIEKYFYLLCNKLSINLLIECGAHDASTSVKFCGSNKNRKAIAFEANPHVVNRFNSEIRNSRIQYLNIGLASAPGKLKLHIPKDAPGSWTPQASFDKNLGFETSANVDIEVNTLDNLIPQFTHHHKLLEPTALWIDVEGFAWEVLQGAQNILSSHFCKFIFLEVSDQKIWENEKSAAEIVDFLIKFDFLPVVRDCPLASLYNIVFVKRSEVDSLCEITNEFWFEFTRLKPGLYEKKSVRTYLSIIKNFLLELTPSLLHGKFEWIFAKLGSKSSQEKLS